MENVDAAKYLISKKSDINVVGGISGGPLHIACLGGHLELARLLTESGANVNLADSGYAGTPLQSAVLGRWCFSFDHWPSEADESKKMETICFLIEEAEADINSRAGFFGNTISAACLRCTPETIKFLLDKGASVDVQDWMERKPIHLASFRTLDHLQLMLDAGERVSVRDKLGRTPLHYAVTSGHLDLV
jgi:ankyrin repeat protein